MLRLCNFDSQNHTVCWCSHENLLIKQVLSFVEIQLLTQLFVGAKLQVSTEQRVSDIL